MELVTNPKKELVLYPAGKKEFELNTRFSPN